MSYGGNTHRGGIIDASKITTGQDLLTNISITLILATITGYFYYRFFYTGKRRKPIGRHRYNKHEAHYSYINGIRTVFPATS